MRSLAVTMLLLLVGAAPASAQCTLGGPVSVSVATIDVPGAEPLEVAFEEQPLAVTLVEGERVPLRAAGALSFEGTVDVDDLPVALRRRTRVGPLILRPGTAIERVAGSGPRARARLRLAEGVHVSVDLPCRVLRLGGTAEPPERVTSARLDLRAAGPALRVHRAPRGPSPVELRVGEPGLRLVELGRRGGWVHVRRDFADGATLLGWVREDAVRRGPPAPRDRRVRTESGAGSACGQVASHTYVGPAALRRGAEVFESREGVVWARARRELEVEVYWRWGSEWVELHVLEGVRNASGCRMIFERAHARREDVELPPRLRAPAAATR